MSDAIQAILGLLSGGTGGLYAILAGVISAIGIALSLYLKGRTDAKAKARLKDLEAYRDTTERMQNAPKLNQNSVDDVAAARGVLRDAAK
jgi:hypothetical protein